MGIVLISGVLAAHFLPEKGMNLLSFKKGDIEAIDQQTQALFEQRYAGLGAMIGPHFHQRSVVPPWPSETLFPHLAFVKAKGGRDPFSHGIGRYAPWRVLSQTPSSLCAALSGDDCWKGIPLKELEGQDFDMTYEATLTEAGLKISLSVTSPHPSIVGLHTYYAFNGPSQVTSSVQNCYNDGGTFKPIPSTWNYDNSQLQFFLPQVADYGFVAAPDPGHGEICLETSSHSIRVQYWGDPKESSWQLWHPEGGTFVCIEPLSAHNPRHCQQRSSHIEILISIGA